MARKIILILVLFFVIPHSAHAAIAVDNTGQTSCTGTFSTCTLSFTVTGSNTLLFLDTWMNAGSPNYSGVTYNGVALTSLTSPYAFPVGWYLVGPATGTHNLVVSCSGNCAGAVRISVASYTGVAQTGQPEATNACLSPTTTSSYTCAVTTVTANSWVMATGNTNNAGTVSSGTSVFTRRIANVGDPSAAEFDTNGAIATPSSTTFTLNNSTSAANLSITIAAFAPYTAPAVLDSIIGLVRSYWIF